MRRHPEHDPISNMQLIEWPYYRTDFLASQGLSPTFVKRFWSKVNISQSCWIWKGAKHSFGYGQIGRWKEGDSPMSAHVAAWILHYGPILDGLWVLHSCDNPACCRPTHLFLGDALANSMDMHSKGRARPFFKTEFMNGALNPNNVLSPEDVALIRSSYKPRDPDFCQRALAERFGCTQTNISSVIRCNTWNYPQTMPS